MAVYFAQQTRERIRLSGETNRSPHTTAPVRVRPNENRSGVQRLSPADVGKFNPASVIDGKSTKGPDFSRIAFQAAQMFPKLIKLHPALRWADFIRELYKLWRNSKLNRDKVKLARQPNLEQNEFPGPSGGGWVLNCDIGVNPFWPLYGGISYSNGLAVPGCSNTEVAWDPAAGLPQRDPTRAAEHANEFWFRTFAPPFGHISRATLRRQWNRSTPADTVPLGEYIPSNTKLDPGSFFRGLRLPGIDPLPLDPEPDPVHPTWKSIPNREPGSHSDRGNGLPSQHPSTNTRAGGAFAFGGPAFGRVRMGRNERKFSLSADHAERLAKYSGLLGNVQGKLKDFKDLVDALHDSLPENLQKDRKSDALGDTLANLYRHYDKLNPVPAVLHILEEIAEDQIGGAGDVIKNEVAKRNGWSKQKLHLSPRSANVSPKVFKPTWWNAKF